MTAQPRQADDTPAAPLEPDFRRRLLSLIERVADIIDLAMDAGPGEASGMLADLSDDLRAEIPRLRAWGPDQ